MARRWRAVPSHPDYDVSDRGDLRSRKRRRVRPLSPTTDPYGYQVVTLDGRSRRVHRLVLEAFGPPCPTPTAETRHLDGDPGNNAVSNLRWGTRSGNMRDVVRHGKHTNASRTTCRRRGHALVAPNLDLGAARAGHRCCYSCHWGYTIMVNHRRQGRLRDRDALGDLMYTFLMDSGPDPRGDAEMQAQAAVADPSSAVPGAVGRSDTTLSVLCRDVPVGAVLGRAAAHEVVRAAGLTTKLPGVDLALRRGIAAGKFEREARGRYRRVAVAGSDVSAAAAAGR